MERLVLCRVVLGTKGVGCTDSRPVQTLPKQAAEVVGPAELDEPPKSTIRIRSGRVDQDTRLVLAALDLGVDALSNAGCVVTALECELADQQVAQIGQFRTPVSIY